MSGPSAIDPIARQNLRTADNGESLCAAADAVGLGDLLDAPASLFCESVPWDSHKAAAILHTLVDQGLAPTIRDLLCPSEFRTPWRRRARAEGDRWLLDAARAFFEADLSARPPPAASADLAPEATAAEALQWAERHEVRDVLQLPAAGLFPRLGPTTERWLGSQAKSLRLVDLFAGATAGSGGPGLQVPFSVKLVARDVLREEAAAVVLARESPNIGRVQVPQLVDMASQLDTLAQRILQHTAPRPIVSPAILATHCTDPTVDRISLPAPLGSLPCGTDGPAAPSLSLATGEALAPTCACGGNPQRCRWVLRLVQSLQGALADPQGNPIIDAWVHRQQTPRWERELDWLVDQSRSPAPDRSEGAQAAWLVTVDARGGIRLEAVWGRPFRRKLGWRIWTGSPPPMGAADRNVHDQLQLLSATRGDPQGSRAVLYRAVEALVEHPAVLLLLEQGPSAVPVPITVRRVEVGLSVTLGDVPDSIALLPAIDSKPWPSHQVVRDILDQCAGDRAVWVDDGLCVARISDAARRVLRLVLDRGATYPAAALGPLVDRLPAFEEALPVSLDERLVGEAVSPSCYLQAHLAWSTSERGESLRLRLRVVPVPLARPRRPGLGPTRALGRVNDEPVHALRDREAEVEAAVEVLSYLDLSPPTGSDARWEWTLSAPEPALTLLCALEDGVARRRLAVEPVWEGPRPGVRRQVQAENLEVSVQPSKRRGWFRLDGSLSIDELEMELADLLDQARRGPRFIRLADGQWAELSAQLRERLATLTDVARPGPDGPVCIPGFAGDAMEALADDGANVAADATWTNLRERIHSANASGSVPTDSLRCQLRPYQQRGVDWMARLTSWGAGAILADEMGLGKTIQTLALLVHRQHLGPSLVVAPSSLVFNWRDETHRFAPHIKVFEYRGQQRVPLLSQLGPQTLLLTTYDILTRDIHLLAPLTFATLVLDEAHAIKNARTHRTRAVHRVQADARVALTGTPIENRLDELWSLVHAVCPGLLGDRTSFRSDFVQPIEGNDDAERRSALARVIRPFVLRRLKSDVAPELPPRTTVVHRVPARADQSSQYARERDRAIAETRKLLAMDSESARVQVLAWLTRLRMLACHPAMVDPAWSGGSAKLDHARELIADLCENQHPVLVFSQFTRHLDLMAACLATDGRRVCRIDGRTPPDQRAAAVRQFQAGEADVFLLSLKAGGTGLNLTNADHVLLLDPWWNPAAEDQAADRAHRIGQTKPVTVIRLVTAGTIEDDILVLQEDKRSLMAALLEGASQAGHLDAAGLAALIRGSDQLRADLDADSADAPLSDVAFDGVSPIDDPADESEENNEPA